MPPAFDGFPAVVATGPRAGRGTADDAALGTHHGEQGGGDVLRAVRGRAGWNEGPQRRDVGGQLGACGAAPGTQGVLDLSLQAGKPRFQVTADGRLRAVALQLADQAPAQHGGEWGADRGLHDRDVGTGQEEQGAPHGHPAHEAAPLVHRRRHIGQARCGAAGEYREVDRGRVGGMQRDQGLSHRFRARGAAAEVVPAHQDVTPPLHRDGSSRHSVPPSSLAPPHTSGLVNLDTCRYRVRGHDDRHGGRANRGSEGDSVPALGDKGGPGARRRGAVERDRRRLGPPAGHRQFPCGRHRAVRPGHPR